MTHGNSTPIGSVKRYPRAIVTPTDPKLATRLAWFAKGHFPDIGQAMMRSAISSMDIVDRISQVRTIATSDHRPRRRHHLDDDRRRPKKVLLAGNQVPERKPSNEWARKMPALIRPNSAVTISIIANVLGVAGRA